MMNPEEIKCLLLQVGHEEALMRFFGDLAEAGDDAYFRPHPRDLASLRELAEAPGKDVYVVFMRESSVCAYGLLRGWNEGYAVPSLGVAVHPDMRGGGLGRLVMEHLEELARNRGAVSVRLRVHKNNRRAIAMYESRGYALRPDHRDDRLLVGSKVLQGSP